MIEASFSRSSRMAAVSGVYQYDTGQRLRMHGLPSPDELLAGDDLLSGTGVTVQVHFSHEGDAQTEMRLAQWDDDRWCWVVDIPDEYLTRIDPVHVYVYVYHGETENSSRARTEYEGVFSPISRPVPNNVASEDMLEQWAELEAEVDLVLSTAGPAQQNAVSQAESAISAANTAQASADNAREAAWEAYGAEDALAALGRTLGGMTVRTVTLAAGSTATAALAGNVLTLGIPKGATGAKGDTGDTGPADITLSFSGGVLTITPK